MVCWYSGPFDSTGLDEEWERFGLENMVRNRHTKPSTCPIGADVRHGRLAMPSSRCLASSVLAG